MSYVELCKTSANTWGNKDLCNLSITSEKNFQCFLCSDTFALATGLAEHIESHTLQKAFRCGFCDESFHENSAMLTHISSMHAGLPVLYNCSLCKVAFQVLLSLEEHVAGCRRNLTSCSNSVDAEDKIQDRDSNFSSEVKNQSVHDISNCHTDHIASENVQSVLLNEICDGIFIKNTKDGKMPQINDSLGEKDYDSSDLPSLTLRKDSHQDPSVSRTFKLADNTDSIQSSPKSGDFGNLFECKVCSQSCDSLELFTIHLRAHDLEELYGIWCAKCDKLFDNIDSLEKHLTYTECSGFQCQKCHKSFSLETSLVKHSILVHNQGLNMDMKCNECGKHFTTLYAWARHEASHSKSIPYVCKICGKHFSSLKHVRGYHLPTAHKLNVNRGNGTQAGWSEDSEVDSTVNDDREEEQKNLRRKKSSSANYPHNLISNKKKAKVALSYPSAKARKKGGRRQKKVIVKRGKSLTEKDNFDILCDQPIPEVNGNVNECKICMQSCNNHEKLREHMASHALEECYSIRCMKCNICFEDAELLEKHLEETDCPGFKCLECQQSFGLEALLLKHSILAHKQGSEMECNECGKKCPSHYAWARHEATHAKSQPYMCKICGKHLSSLEHVLRYHLPTAHKLGKSNKNKKNSVFSVSEAPSHSNSSPSEVRNENKSYHKKRRVSSKPITSLIPKKSKVKTCSATPLPNVQSKAEPAPKRWVCIDCDICGGKVSDHQALANHRSYHFMEGKVAIQCSGCSEFFSNLDDLTSHVREKQCTQYKCGDCKQIFPTELSYVTHKAQNHTLPQDLGFYNCLECHQDFESLSTYVEHSAKHVTSESFQCNICNASFISEVLLEVHLDKTHTLIKNDQESNTYKCAQCLETFRTKEAIRVHRRFHMQREVLCENKEDPHKSDSSFASYLTSFYCQICSVGFGGAVHLERHEQMHSVVAGKPKCPICGQIFQRNCYLKVHLGHHNRPFLCTACGKTFSSSQTLKHHSLAYHSAVNPFQCHQCNKFYSSKGALRHHLKGHSGEKRFECKLCGKKFSDSTCLESHILIHSVEKRFKCKVCSYECRHRSVLARHMDMHNGVKRYKCSYCGMRFRQHSGLKAHLTTHTGEKNYECEYCGKRFARKDYLNVHTLTHTKEKPLSCPECNDSFAVASNLNVHVKKVHGEEAYRLFQEQKARNRGLSGASVIHHTFPSQETSAVAAPVVLAAPAPHPPPPAVPGAIPPVMPQAVNTMIYSPSLYPPPLYETDGSGHPVYHQPQQMFYNW